MNNSSVVNHHNNTRPAAIFLWLVFLGLAAGYLWSPLLYGNNFTYFTNLIYLVAPIIAAITGITLVRAYGKNSEHGRSFMSIAFALILLLAAEILWIVYEFTNISPYPSPADALYLISYIFLFIGFMREWQIGGNSLPKTLWVAISLVSFVVVILSFNLTYDPTASTLENSVALAYNLIDLLVLISVIMALFNMRAYGNGRLYRPWFWLFIGVLATFVANLLYLYFIDAYESKVWLARQMDLLWVITYLTFTYAFISIGNILKDVQSRLLT